MDMMACYWDKMGLEYDEMDLLTNQGLQHGLPFTGASFTNMDK